MSDETVAPQSHVSLIQEPPTTVPGILRRLGPGLIIAAAIVGSGELIATTKTGAEAGFLLLWLILIGCVIKVFAQVEFGRYTIVTGKTSMSGMNEVPGPRLRVNWLLWYWLLMFLFSLGQLGGIVGGVGQALAISLPITGDFNRLLDEQLQREQQVLSPAAERQPLPPGSTTKDDIIWATVMTIVTAVILVVGRYNLIQALATFMVAAFTALTVFNVVALQSRPEWSVRASDLIDGFRFHLPGRSGDGPGPVATALAAFGIIGVGATELIAYPYWCLEKGYARFTGPRDASVEWARRAAGWMRVMRWDAFCSMAIYTFATVAFYLLGASILHRAGKNPEGNQMIRTLSEMYVPVFGVWAEWLFLFGAFAVLYSTFFVATASHARTCADAVYLFGRGAQTETSFRRWTQLFCGVFPFASLALFLLYPKPTRLVLASGVMQAIMLPMLGGAALFFRYRRCDERIKPGRLWDVLLWISVGVLLIAGVGAVLVKAAPGIF